MYVVLHCWSSPCPQCGLSGLGISLADITSPYQEWFWPGPSSQAMWLDMRPVEVTWYWLIPGAQPLTVSAVAMRVITLYMHSVQIWRGDDSSSLPYVHCRREKAILRGHIHCTCVCTYSTDEGSCCARHMKGIDSLFIFKAIATSLKSHCTESLPLFQCTLIELPWWSLVLNLILIVTCCFHGDLLILIVTYCP